MEKRFIKPASGLQIRDPNTRQVISAEGQMVILNSYWRRRIKDGSVNVSRPAKKSVGAPPAPVRSTEKKGADKK